MPFTTIKTAKGLLAAILSVLMICQTAVAADHKSNYELGLEKAANGKYDIAIRYFKKVAESDPSYSDAQTQIQLAEEKQAEASQASKTQTQINQDTDRCRNLFEKDRSPDAFDCVERVKRLQEKASEEFGGKEFKSSALQNLEAEMTPYAKVDELADRVRGIAMDANGMDNAQEDLDLLEGVLYTKEFPEDAKTIAAVVLTNTYKGATMAFKTSCEIAREGTDQQAADKICGRHEESLNKYTSIKTYLDQSVKLLGDKQVPSKLYSTYKPIGDGAAALPQPKELALTEKNPVIPAGAAGIKADESMPSWVPYAAIGTVVVVIFTAICWPRKPAPAKKALTDRQDRDVSRGSTGGSTANIHESVAVRPLTNPTADLPRLEPQPSAITVTNRKPYEVEKMTELVNEWLEQKPVALASDTKFTALKEYAEKLGLFVKRPGSGSAQKIEASIKDTSKTPHASDLMNFINQHARR